MKPVFRYGLSRVQLRLVGIIKRNPLLRDRHSWQGVPETPFASLHDAFKVRLWDRVCFQLLINVKKSQ